MSGVRVSNDLMNMLTIFCRRYYCMTILTGDMLLGDIIYWQYYAGDILLAIFLPWISYAGLINSNTILLVPSSNIMHNEYYLLVAFLSCYVFSLYVCSKCFVSLLLVIFEYTSTCTSMYPYKSIEKLPFFSFSLIIYC